MRISGTNWMKWVGLTTAALLLTGCTQTDRQRWNEFWGLDQPTDSKPVVRSARPKRASNSRDARSATPRKSRAAGREVRAQDTQSKIDRYVRAMPSDTSEGFVPNGLESKIRRQEDPNRRERIRKAAQKSRGASQPDLGIAANSRFPSGAPSGRESRPIETDRDSVVRPASVKTPVSTPSPAEPVAGDHAVVANEDVKAEPNRSGTIEKPAITPAHPTGEDPDGGWVPPDKIGEVKKNITPSTANDTSKAPVLAEMKISAGPEPVPEKTKPKIDKQIQPNQPLTRDTIKASEPVDTFALRLKQQLDQVTKQPNNIEQQYRLRMMYLIDGRDEQALASIEGVDADIQEIIQAQIKTFIAARSSAGRDPATWANRQLDAVEELRQHIKARADLQIPKVVLCTAIDGYGRYKPIEPAEFSAGRKNLVLVYIEVDNFTSRATSSGHFRTLLSVRWTVLNKAGDEILSKQDQNIEDLALEKRRDFFLSIGPVAIPRTLSPGEYLLKVEVEDVLAGKINSHVTHFKILP